MGAPLNPQVIFGFGPAATPRTLREKLSNAVSGWTGIGGGHQSLYVTAESLVAMRQVGRRWQVTASFRLGPVADSERSPGSAVAASPVPEAFREWIGRWRGDTFSFLLDSADEEIELDELPNVRGRDRDKVLDRRLKQRFRDAALTAWMVPHGGAAKKGAKTPGARECTLLVGLRQRNPMMAWIESALSTGARIAAIDSLALRAAQVLRGQGAGAGSTVLLAGIQPGGLRQTLVHNGAVCFTRLQPLEPGAPWQRVAEELDRTVRFLMMSRASLRPLIQAGKVPIAVIGSGIDRHSAGAYAASALPLREAAVPITWIDLDASAGDGVAAPADTPLGGLLLFLSAGRGHAANYATRDMRANWRTARALAAGWSFATIALLAALGANLFIQYTLSGRMDAVGARPRRAAVEAVRAQAQELQQKLSAQAVSAEEMDAVVTLAAQLRSRHVDAAQTLRWIGQALGRDSAVNLDEIAWEPARPLGAAAVPGAAPPPPEAAPQAPSTAPTANTGASSPSAVRISGYVDPAISKESANGKIAALLARLKTGCDCTGRIVLQPYDPSMDVAYAASLRDGSRVAVPRFTLELERPAPPLAGAVSGAVINPEHTEGAPHG